MDAAIIGREITMSALREWAASCSQEAHQAVAVSSWGKWKTATQVSNVCVFTDCLGNAGVLDAHCAQHCALLTCTGSLPDQVAKHECLAVVMNLPDWPQHVLCEQVLRLLP